MRRYFLCESLQLVQEGVQVGGHGFDHDSVDTTRAVLLNSPENCVGVTLKGTFGVASPELIAHLTVPYEVHGLEQGAPVTSCQLKDPIPKIWGQLRHFS